MSYMDKGELMTEIIFYENNRGEEPVKQWLESLTKGKTRNDVLLGKVLFQMRRLENEGTNLKMPSAKFLKGQQIPLWELRPQPERILYASLVGDKIILLHNFTKKRNDTPQKELDIAVKRYFDWIERNGENNG